MDKVGTLFVISAPSGGGKTSLVQQLVKNVPNVMISISYTTREQRPGEINGQDYHFVSESQFQSLLSQDAFMEHAEVFGHHYGTLTQWVEIRLKSGLDVVLEIDWQGARQVKQHFPESVGVFILPPSISVLRQRLLKRGRDELGVIDDRMAEAQAEMSHYDEYNYVVINDSFDTALGDLTAIVKASRLRQSAQRLRYKKLIEEILA